MIHTVKHRCEMCSPRISPPDLEHVSDASGEARTVIPYMVAPAVADATVRCRIRGLKSAVHVKVTPV